jgi:hypothetical protein
MPSRPETCRDRGVFLILQVPHATAEFGALRQVRPLLRVVVRTLKVQGHVRLITHHPAVVGNLRDVEQLARPKLEQTPVLQRCRCRARTTSPR